MNRGEANKIIIIAIVLALILAGIVWWAQTQDLNAPTTPVETEEQVEAEADAIDTEIEELDDLNIDAELQELEADLEVL